ncbi:MAG: hypothetical protein M4D85_03310, partial [Actinomycetota bacterium]|nr:hypothetical protein [Actinomycetota bacterium]
MSSYATSRPRSLVVTVVAASAPLVALALLVSPAYATPPADGSVGNAVDKAPPGQSPGDANHGRDCDTNPGAGNGNPALLGCIPD